MTMLSKQLKGRVSQYFTDRELTHLLDKSPDSRYGKIKRAIAQNEIIRIRRGLYCFVEHQVGVDVYEVAQRIYGPSYVSLESALSYHGLIPESVQAITSVCTKRSKNFKTYFGIFNYSRLPQKNFFVGVERVETETSVFFIATPWKAICDYIYVRKKDWKNMEPLIHSLRIERSELPTLEANEVEALNAYYQSSRVSRFLKGVCNER